jgi:hypothetical protein
MEHGALGTLEHVAELRLSIVEQEAQRLTVHFAVAPPPDGAMLFTAGVFPHLTR